MELALAVLLVSAFTCAGLIALWAAISPRHWFLRTAVFLGTLAPLLLIPVYSPFATFLLQGITITLGIQLPRYWRNRPTPFRFVLPKFSLLSSLLTMTLIAVMIPIIQAIYTDKWFEWEIIWKLGLPAVLTTLLAHWCDTTRLKNRWIKTVIVISTLLLLGATLNWLEPSSLSLMLVLLHPESLPFGASWDFYTWSAVFGAIFLITNLTLLFAHYWKHLFSRVSLTLLLFLATAPSLYCYYRLVALPPLPEVKMPSPNGHDDLIAASKLADVRLIIFYETIPAEQLVIGLPKHAAIYEHVELGLSHSIKIHPLSDDSSYTFLDSIQAIRILTDAFFARAKSRLYSNAIDEAIDDYLTVIQLATKGRTGGVLHNWLCSTTSIEASQLKLYQAHQRFNTQQCQRIIKSILEIESAAEPLEKIAEHEQIWHEHLYGIYGHLESILQDVANEQKNNELLDDIKTTYLPQHQTEQRLLLTALAIHGYQLTENKLPNRLQDLVPDYLQQLPQDPFSKQGQSLRYQPTDTGFKLYSIGPNHEDDGGTKPELNANETENRETGDILLTEVFAPKTPPSTTQPNTQPDASTEDEPPIDAD